MMKAFLSCALLSLTTRVVTSDVVLPLPMPHPDFPFEPVYLRKYSISVQEAATLDACQGLAHDCDWGMIVVLRQESCIPDDFALTFGAMEDEAALQCPLLVQGYSIFDTDNTSPGVKPHKQHITNQPGVGLPAFIFNNNDFERWERENDQDFTYGQFVQWVNQEEVAYRGVVKEFFEVISNNNKESNTGTWDEGVLIPDSSTSLFEEGDLTVVAKGVLEGDNEFSFTIDEVGDTYIPVVWDVVITGGEAFKTEESKGLEEGALAGAIIGAAIGGAILGALLMSMFKGSPTSTSAPESSTNPHKDVEATESHHVEPTESHEKEVEG